MIDLDQARDKMKDILNSQEYQVYYEDNRNFLQRTWDSVVEWFNDILMSIFSSLEPSNGLATGLVVILGIITLVLVILAIFFAIRHFNRKRRFQEQSYFFNKEKDWTPQAHLAKANEFENNEDLPMAIRHLFLALLLYYHERGYIKPRIWKTNWEYFEELKHYEKKRAESFFQLARIFEDVVYGERNVEIESYVTYKDLVLYWVQEPPGDRVEEEKGGRH